VNLNLKEELHKRKKKVLMMSLKRILMIFWSMIQSFLMKKTKKTNRMITRLNLKKRNQEKQLKRKKKLKLKNL